MSNKKKSIYGRYMSANDEYEGKQLTILYNRENKMIDVFTQDKANKNYVRSYSYQELDQLKQDFGKRKKIIKNSENSPTLGENIDLISSKDGQNQNFTKEDYEKANASNLLEFIEKQNIAIDRVGADSYKGVEHDSLVITPSNNAWFWNSRQVGGVGAKSFAQKYILADQQMNDKEKSRLATKMVLESNVSVGYKKVKTTPFIFRQNQIGKSFDQAYSYLTKIRKLNPEIVNRLHKTGLIEQDRQGNALFLWSDLKEDKVVGTSIQGTTIDFDRYGKRGTLKKIERNSTTKMGWSFDVKKRGTVPENLVFCESAIDAISYYNASKQAGKDLHSTRIVSMEGLKKGVAENYIANQIEELEKVGKSLKTVKFAVDRDDAGTTFITKMQELQNQAKEKETKFQLENKNHEKKDDFAADLKVFEHKEIDRFQIALSKAPKFESRQPPVSSGVKDWNDFVKKMDSGQIQVKKNRINEKLAENFPSSKNLETRENIYKPVTQSILQQQYLRSQGQDMSL